MYRLVKLSYPLISSEWELKKEKGLMLSHDIGILEVDKEDIGNQAIYVEENFEIRLQGKEIYLPDLPRSKLGIYIGAGNSKGQEKELDINQIEVDESDRWVIVRTKGNTMMALQYLIGIIELLRQAKEANKELIIYADYIVEQNRYQYRALLWRVINELADREKVVFIHRLYGDMKAYYSPQNEKFESYIENGIYTEDLPEKAIFKLNKIGEWGHRTLKRLYRESPYTLYDDVFYNKISDGEIIYIPTLKTARLPRSSYEALGINYIKIEHDYGILRGTKKQFDQAAEELYGNVLPDFAPQILTYQPLEKNICSTIKRELPQFNLTSTSKGVCIAFIGTDGIDYRKPCFLNEEGKSRVEYVWEQIDGGEGKIYTKQDIDQAIENDEALSILPPEGEMTSTMLFNIAAGTNNGPNDLAGESTFAFVKLKGVSKELQALYAGGYHSNTVMLEDVIIALNQLITFKEVYYNPIVIGVPYGTNLSSHDGSSILENGVWDLSNQLGVTIITPTGDEGDKRHHSKVILEGEEPQSIELNIEGEGRTVVGMMWVDIPSNVSSILYSPDRRESYNISYKVDIEEPSINLLSTGIQVSYHNGSRYNFFRMSGMMQGAWSIEFKKENNLDKATIDIWLACEQYNQYATLNPADPFCTIPSVGSIPSVITVGAHDPYTFTVNQSAGRGYTRNNLINPSFLLDTVEFMGGGEEQVGGLVCMAQMSAIVANIYSEWLQSIKKELANTFYMKNILSTYLRQLETFEYPNPSHGYGIFTVESFRELMKQEFNIQA